MLRSNDGSSAWVQDMFSKLNLKPLSQQGSIADDAGGWGEVFYSFTNTFELPTPLHTIRAKYTPDASECVSIVAVVCDSTVAVDTILPMAS